MGRELDTGTVCRLFEEAGSKVTLHEAESFKPLAEALENTDFDTVERIVVAGGDGTVSGLVRFAVDNDKPYGVLPCGTANDFAGALGIPGEPLDAAKVLVDGQVRSIDVGVINDFYFLNAAGMGIGTRVTKSLDSDDKQRLGVFAYVMSLWDAVAKRRRFRVELRFDDETTRDSVWQVTVTNGLRYGGGVAAPAGAELDDGVLQVVRVKPQSLLGLFASLPSYVRGNVDDLHRIRADRTSTLTVETRRPMEVSVDGELLTRTPCKFSCRPAALRVIVPAETE